MSSLPSSLPSPSALVDPAVAPSDESICTPEAEGFMRQALLAAEAAASIGEVPVGAIVVVRGEVVAVAHNERETKNDPTAHAEVVALRRAAAKLGSWRLINAELYV